MKKQIFAVTTICILLFTGLVSTAKTVKLIQETQDANNQKSKFCYLDNDDFIFTTIVEDSDGVGVGSSSDGSNI